MKRFKKEYRALFLIVVTIAIAVTLFFFPDSINYPYSYTALANKKEEIESGNLTLRQNEVGILEKSNELAQEKERAKEKNKEYLELKRSIREEDFVFDMPSLLITLEQEANNNKVSLNIDYNAIRTSGEKTEDDSSVDTNSEDEEDREGENRKEDDSKEQEDTEDSTSEDNDSKDNDEKPEDNEVDNEEEQEVAQVAGLDVTTIPITIEGTYSNVRNFIKYLDELGMIEPSSVTLTSEEKKVKGEIVLNVFHGEVF